MTRVRGRDATMVGRAPAAFASRRFLWLPVNITGEFTRKPPDVNLGLHHPRPKSTFPTHFLLSIKGRDGSKTVTIISYCVRSKTRCLLMSDPNQKKMNMHADLETSVAAFWRSARLHVDPAPSLRIPVTPGNRALLRRLRAIEQAAWQGAPAGRSLFDNNQSNPNQP